MASKMLICLRCGLEGHAARDCSLPFFKSDKEARREVVKIVQQREKGVRELEKLLKAKEREKRMRELKAKGVEKKEERGFKKIFGWFK